MKTEENNANDEARIRLQISSWVKAFSTKDVNLMMSFFAPEIVSFDVVPPLQGAGKDTWRKTWEQAFGSFQDTIHLEIQDLNITMGDSLAYSHNLLRLHATRSNGQKIDYWERLTFCFRNIDSKWLITHEHVSVPFDPGSSRAVLDLKP